MRRSATGMALGLFVALTVGQCRGEGPEAKDLRRGLVAVFKGTGRGQVLEVTQLEPTVALALKAGEAPHPRLPSDSVTVVWQGYLNVLRNGGYRFGVRLRGEFRLSVAGKEMLKLQARADEPVLQEGAEVQLEAGLHTIRAEFTSLPKGVARVELLWQGPGFRQEPLPFNFVGHLPGEEPTALAADAFVERGRFLFEEASCIRCHQADDKDHVANGLKWRQGPDLSKIGARAHAGWMERWLDSPRKMRPGAAMPELFGHDETGRAERYAVARYLATLGGPVKANAKKTKPQDYLLSALRGQSLFNSIGCVACHNAEGNRDEANTFFGPLVNHPLHALGSKTTTEKLAEYLKNPLAVDPSGRMPHLLLDDREATDIARFLCHATDESIKDDLGTAPERGLLFAAFKRVEPRVDEFPAFEKLTPPAAWSDLGKRLVIARGCNNCHTIEPEGNPFAQVQANADLSDLKKLDNPKAGCLAAKPDPKASAPFYAFNDAERSALRAFLKTGLTGAGSPAPAHVARTDLRRFNCLACHNRDGEGGLSPEMLDLLRLDEKAENAESISPPPLTGVAHKLRTPWLRQVLTGAGRARPWMTLRMPQFGEAQVGKLPEALAALEGTNADEAIHKVALDVKQIEAGRLLVGKTAFGCISCHDIAGNVTGGTRGPDLALMSQRVRHDWYVRWLEQAQRMQPGTRMPEVFTKGKSLFDALYDGDAGPQAEAMWAYLSLGPTLPLPAGLDPPRGLVLRAEDRPILLRTFMPDAGTKAIAVGFPGGVAATFDAATCRLAYAWSGNFLDATPVWGGRGGSPAKVLGTRFWTSPLGCPLALSSSGEPPDFAARAKEPAYGAELPEGEPFTGTPLLRFAGYGTDKAGNPIFRYTLNTEKTPAEVSEQSEPLRAAVAIGILRRFTIEAPAGLALWLNAGDAKGAPRLLDARGDPLALEWMDGRVTVPAVGRMLVLPQDGEKVIVLALASPPKGAEWRVEKRGASWQVLLRVPPLGEAGKVALEMKVWAPYRDELRLFRTLGEK